MKPEIKQQDFITFSPALMADDPVANYWLHQATFRLRREICWRWRQVGASGTNSTALPPLIDRVSENLDLTRYWDEKRQFFQTDPTAKYLTDLLAAEPPNPNRPAAQGSFSWLVNHLALDDVSAFVLALGLIVTFDHAAGDVIAVCQNEPGATYPTLALAQGLWDWPQEVLRLADLAHPLWRYGLLQPRNDPSRAAVGFDWRTPIVVPPIIAHCLLFTDLSLPDVLVPIGEGHTMLSDNARIVSIRLSSQPLRALRIVPIRGATGSNAADVVRGIAQITKKEVVELALDSLWLESSAYLKSLITFCWLNNLDVFMRNERVGADDPATHASRCVLAVQSIPVTLFLGIHERSELSAIPNHLLLPIVHLPKLSYTERIHCWQHVLGLAGSRLQKGIAECARRFRYEKTTIHAIGAGLRQRAQRLTDADLVAGCRAELDLDIGELAQAVTPRFSGDELVLPPKQQGLFQEILQAMQSLTEVHYGWGTGRAWNESGISVLFAGPPGTGKTMAAEILAAKLDLPMYRIDLSQVVNKYIGETEKNLKKLFDAADISDTLLFFDEADALFGRRTEVKDAHDRYANLEISYLLERMERFKGLAILATNRKKDLDEAFLRRLRYIVDFPLPDVRERKQIWQQVIPDAVDISQLDFQFLAKQFALSGGHIRSIVFNACLQTADGSTLSGSNVVPRLTMEQVIIAIKREYDKLNRAIRPAQFGPYAPLVEGLEHGQS